MDGLTQGPALEANAVDGQDTVPNMDSASPWGGGIGQMMKVRYLGLQSGVLPLGNQEPQGTSLADLN